MINVKFLFRMVFTRFVGISSTLKHFSHRKVNTNFFTAKNTLPQKTNLLP